MPEPDLQPQPSRAGCGAIALTIIGLLILIPSGLCTGTLILIDQPIKAQDVGFVLSIGGPFILVGGLLTWLGIQASRRR
jgi:hypothetical protein